MLGFKQIFAIEGSRCGVELWEDEWGYQLYIEEWGYKPTLHSNYEFGAEAIADAFETATQILGLDTWVAVLLLVGLFIGGCGAELTPNIHKAQMEEEQTEEEKKQTKLIERQTIAIERLVEYLTRRK